LAQTSKCSYVSPFFLISGGNAHLEVGQNAVLDAQNIPEC